MAKPSKIAIVISSLAGGGAEHVVCTMANFWHQAGRDVVVICFSDASERSQSELSPQVKVIALACLGKKSNAIQDNWNRIRKIREAIRVETPSVILSFMETVNILTILAARGSSVPVYVADRIDPQSYSYGKHWRILRNLTYGRAKAVIVQTQAVVKRYPKHIQKRIAVINNFVKKADDISIGQHKIICAAGRLHSQKAFDVLIEAFSKITNENPEWNLVIYGEGEERKELQNLIEDRKMKDRIALPGFSKDLRKNLSSASLFVLSSRYEGFPNILLEAMASGLAVISTRCPFGPEEIVTDKEDGLLVDVDDIDALAEKMSILMRDPDERVLLAENAKKSVEAKYGLNTIMKQWDGLLCVA